MVGLIEGLEIVEVNPEGLEVQLYVFPPTAVAPILVGEPLHTELLVPAFASGLGLIVIITLSYLEQPVAVMESVK